jgi:protein-arginine kinase activator protein McsA
MRLKKHEAEEEEDEEEDSLNCVLCGLTLENINDIDGLCNACINKIG